MANSFHLNVHIWKQISLEIRDWETGWRKMGGRAGTHKFEQKRVFPERTDASGESEDEHHPSYYDKQPDRVKAAQICDGGNV